MKNNNNMPNRKLICQKKDINLYKIEKNNKIYFDLECNITNNNIIVRNLVNFKLFELMTELNKDIIEKQIILNSETNNIDNIIIFNKLSDDLGINKQYFSTRTYLQDYQNKTVFKSEHINISPKTKMLYDFSKCDLIKDSNNTLEFNYLDNHSMNCKYSFSMDLEEELPSYMENMLGLLMKKVIFRLKTFIENI